MKFNKLEDWENAANKAADDLRFAVDCICVCNTNKAYNDLFDIYQKRKEEFLNLVADFATFSGGHFFKLASDLKIARLTNQPFYYYNIIKVCNPAGGRFTY